MDRLDKTPVSVRRRRGKSVYDFPSLFLSLSSTALIDFMI